jgi:hypothetical protein
MTRLTFVNLPLKREARCRMQDAGGRMQEAGGRRQDAGGRRQEERITNN